MLAPAADTKCINCCPDPVAFPKRQADPDDVESFLDCLFRYADPNSYLALRSFLQHRQGQKAKLLTWVRIGDPQRLDEICKNIAQSANHSKPLVFSPPVATFKTSRNARTTNLADGVALSVECDDRPSEARETLAVLLGPPTCVVISGGLWTNPETGEIEDKVHLHWRLSEPTRTEEDHRKLREARRLATNIVKGDATAIAVVHPLRWPGSWHLKNNPRPVRIEADPDVEIDLDVALEKLWEKVGPEKVFENVNNDDKRIRIKDMEPRAGGLSDDPNDYECTIPHIEAAISVLRIDDMERDEWIRIGYGLLDELGDDGAEFWFAISRTGREHLPEETLQYQWDSLKRSNTSGRKATIRSLFFAANRFDPDWRRLIPSSFGGPTPEAKAEAKGEKKSEAKAEAKPEEKAEAKAEAKPAPKKTPFILIVAGEVSRVVDEVETALIGADLPIFERARSLVYPVKTELPAADDTKTESVLLRTMRNENVIYQLNKHAAVCTRFDERKKKWVKTDLASKTADILLQKGEWKFQQVAGVITAPTLRPDGTVLDQPGYDAKTQLLYTPDQYLKIPPIKAEPTKEDARAALGLFKELIIEFPFEEDLDRAVALAGLLTPLLRGAFDVGPMFLMLAHQVSNGKSYLVNLAAALATGHNCPVITNCASDEEMEKRLGALVLEGAPIISLDNCSFDINGDLLCQITEQRLVRVRILGKSETPRCEWRGTMFATGNNIRLVGDMTRRGLLCNLDAKLERPELRKFKANPMASILQNRGKYIAAAITIARAYRVAGEDAECGPIASYGQWSKAVREPLVWLGEKDPVASMDTAQQTDPLRVAALELVEHWRENLELNISYTAAEVVKIASQTSSIQVDGLYEQHYKMPEFFDLLEMQAGAGRGHIDPTKVGRWLMSIRGQVHDGYKLSLVRGNNHGNRFALVKA
jgi:hypothetical protein